MESTGSAQHRVEFGQISSNSPMSERMKILVLMICVCVATVVVMTCSSYGSCGRKKGALYRARQNH